MHILIHLPFYLVPLIVLIWDALSTTGLVNEEMLFNAACALERRVVSLLKAFPQRRK